MIKVLYLPLNTTEITQTGMYDAFKSAGTDLHIFDYHKDELKKYRNHQAVSEALVQRALEVKPDLLHMQLQFTNIISPGSIAQIKKRLPNTIITNWTGDVRKYVPRYFVSVGEFVDYNLISSTGQIPLFKAAGCKNVKYWQIGYNPKLYHPVTNSGFSHDVVFIGNYFGSMFPGSAERQSVLVALKNSFGRRFSLVGCGWGGNFGRIKPVRQNRVNSVYSNSFCALSVSNFNNIADYFSDRFLMCLASGRPTIAYVFPNINKYVTDGESALFASTPQQFVQKVKWCLNNRMEANRIGVKGAQVAVSKHTYHCRVVELLKLVGLR